MYRQRIVLLFVVGLLALHGAAVVHAQSNVVCDFNNNRANRGVCNNLISSLQGDFTTLSTSPRSICLSQSGNTCCVSWSKPAPGVTKNDLSYSAVKVNNQCQDNGLVSGLERGVNLNGVFCTQCLSSRASGCSGN